MKIDYKKELEDAARTMILVHKPQTLIKLIVRMIVRKVRVRHAGILLYDNKKNTYVLTVSKGKLGDKVPAGFARIDPDNVMIRFFSDRNNHRYIDDGALTYSKITGLLKRSYLLKKHKGLKQTLQSLRNQMNLFQTQVCVPSYFHRNMLGILLLGKKTSGKNFHRDELDFFVALSHDVAMAIRNAQLFEELQSEIESKKRLFLETTKALATTIDAKDHYTHGHTERVTQISLSIAKKLIITHRIKVDPAFLEDLNISGLLHDIGKIGVPEYILNKRERLTEDEKRRINEHPLIGASILDPIKDLRKAIDGVLYHHERFDGTGYPMGLKGENIPLISAIIAVADSYDAMITNRPYRPALSKEKTIEEIQKASGTQYNPLVVKALVELYYEKSL